MRVNPRILDSKLIDLALLKAYPKEHARESMSFQATPPGYVQQGLEPPSTQPAAGLRERGPRRARDAPRRERHRDAGTASDGSVEASPAADTGNSRATGAA